MFTRKKKSSLSSSSGEEDGESSSSSPTGSSSTSTSAAPHTHTKHSSRHTTTKSRVGLRSGIYPSGGTTASGIVIPRKRVVKCPASVDQKGVFRGLAGQDVEVGTIKRKISGDLPDQACVLPEQSLSGTYICQRGKDDCGNVCDKYYEIVPREVRQPQCEILIFDQVLQRDGCPPISLSRFAYLPKEAQNHCNIDCTKWVRNEGTGCADCFERSEESQTQTEVVTQQPLPIAPIAESGVNVARQAAPSRYDMLESKAHFPPYIEASQQSMLPAGAGSMASIYTTMGGNTTQAYPSGRGTATSNRGTATTNRGTATTYDGTKEVKFDADNYEFTADASRLRSQSPTQNTQLTRTALRTPSKFGRNTPSPVTNSQNNCKGFRHDSKRVLERSEAARYRVFAKNPWASLPCASTKYQPFPHVDPYRIKPKYPLNCVKLRPMPEREGICEGLKYGTLPTLGDGLGYAVGSLRALNQKQGNVTRQYVNGI